MSGQNSSSTSPPEGSSPDMVSASSMGLDSMGPEILGSVWAMTVVATFFLAARLWVKYRSRKDLWWDDYALFASWTMLLAFAASTTHCVVVGLGRHNGSSDIQTSALQLDMIISSVFSVLGAAWSKTSFALTLLRITRKGHRLVYWAVWVVIVTMNVVLVFNAILQFIWCVPTAAAWNIMPNSKCWDRQVVVKYTIFAAGYSAMMDFLLATVPWVVIIGLGMRKKEKVGVVICMSLGVFAGCTSIMRALKVSTLYSGDYTYQAGALFIWSGAELATTIVAASIPILRVLFVDIVRSRSSQEPMTELNTFRSLKEGGGIRVTHTTVITRSPSKRLADRGEPAGWKEDTEDLLMDDMPLSPVPTYHSYVQK